MLSGIGAEGQQKLLDSSVLIVGCGALGSVASLYLAGSGIGRIGLVDFDTVDVSNLQRQLSFTTADVSTKKSVTLGDKLRAINPDIHVEIYDEFLTPRRAKELIAQYDVIVEGSDNPDTKYMVSDACVALGKPYVMGGISGYGGQVTSYSPGHAAYRDIFPEAAAPDGFTPCALGGVLGPLPGIVGSIQASEVIKIVTGIGEPLFNRLLLVDAESMQFRRIGVGE